MTIKDKILFGMALIKEGCNAETVSPDFSCSDCPFNSFCNAIPTPMNWELENLSNPS